METYLSYRLSRDKIEKMQFKKVMFGNKAHFNGIEYSYEIGEINIAKNWNPQGSDVKLWGGFCMSTEDAIFRWLVRGNTIYDVIIPEDAEVYDCWSPSTPHGVFRTNKMVIHDSQIITDQIAMNLYNKSNIPEVSYYKALAGCALQGYLNTCMQIISDKVNTDNIDVVLHEIDDFCRPFGENHLFDTHLDCYGKVMSILKNIKKESSY